MFVNSCCYLAEHGNYNKSWDLSDSHREFAQILSLQYFSKNWCHRICWQLLWPWYLWTFH